MAKINYNNLKNEIILRWNLNAEWWSNKIADNNPHLHYTILTSEIINLVDNVNGKSILDAGCGDGYLSRLLTNLGGEVTGIDVSEKMISIAKEYSISKNDKIKYLELSIQSLTALNNCSFDIVIANMVIMDSYDMESMFSELKRVLKPGGELIFSILHPSTFQPKNPWFKAIDAQKFKLLPKIRYKYVEDVYEIRLHPDSPIKTFYFSRKLIDYYKLLEKLKLTIVNEIEPKISPDLLRDYDSVSQLIKFPPFLLLNTYK